jgi:hypothetical protein
MSLLREDDAPSTDEVAPEPEHGGCEPPLPPDEPPPMPPPRPRRSWVAKIAGIAGLIVTILVSCTAIGTRNYLWEAVAGFVGGEISWYLHHDPDQPKFGDPEFSYRLPIAPDTGSIPEAPNAAPPPTLPPVPEKKVPAKRKPAPPTGFFGSLGYDIDKALGTDGYR